MRTRCASTQSRASTCWSSTSIRSSARWLGRTATSRPPPRTLTSAAPPCCGRRPRTTACGRGRWWTASDYARASRGARTAGPVRLGEATRFRLAAKAFEHTARYDRAIAGYFDAVVAGTEAPPAAFARDPGAGPVREARSEMRYGENPAPARRLLRRMRSARGGERYRRRRAAPGEGALLQQRRRRRCRARMRPRPSSLPPASSSSTPTPAEWRWGKAASPPTRGPSPPTRAPRSGASSPSTVLSTPTPPKAILERQFVEVIVAPARRAPTALARSWPPKPERPVARLRRASLRLREPGVRLQSRSMVGSWFRNGISARSAKASSRS